MPENGVSEKGELELEDFLYTLNRIVEKASDDLGDLPIGVLQPDGTVSMVVSYGHADTGIGNAMILVPACSFSAFLKMQDEGE